jgi:type I restriction-modification system DNA methylase subunit
MEKSEGLRLSNIFKYSLNVLRDNEHLTGDKALRTLAYLLDLKLLEPQIGKDIDIDNFNYDFEGYDGTEEEINELKNKLLLYVRFSNLEKQKEVNLPQTMKYLWDIILSIHPKTNKIFIKNKGFDIQNQSTYKKIIDKLNSFNFSTIENDILGEAYEEVIKDVMVGKTLGQFFTPPKIKNIIVELINPQVYKDGTIETIFDPCMGTGGFLISSLRHLIKQNIPLNWEFIYTKGLSGREPEPDTYQLAISNMLISSGHMFNNLEKDDSIRNHITNKYDIIVTNPPFGIKGLNYDEIPDLYKYEYLPIKTNNAVSLFLQAVIYILKINGRCGIVLPDGQDLFGTNKTLVAIREYLLKTCDLKKIIYLPENLFTNTSIKTCIFYFHKKIECSKVIEVKTKSYKFVKIHQTKKVRFYNYNLETNKNDLLIKVDIDKIADNNYSLNYKNYLEKETDNYNQETTIKTLGEVCNFEIGGTPKRDKNEYYENGNHLWISVKELNGGYIYDTKEKITDLGVKKSSVKLYDINTILFSFKLSIGKTGIVGKPMYSNEAIAGIYSKNENILLNKFLYYYLTITDFSNLGSGILGNGSLNKKSLDKLEIPVPSIEKQLEIINYCEFNDSIIIKLEKEIKEKKEEKTKFVYSLLN